MSYSRALIASASIGGVLLAAPATLAHAYDTAALHIGHPWIKTPPNAAPAAAGYLTVTNHGKAAERLTGGESATFKAEEPHTMSMTGAVMRLRLAKDGLAIPPGGTLTLAPGGDHLMLIAPGKALKAGDKVPVTLTFAHAGKVRVEFIVQDGAPAAPMSHESMPGMDMH